MNTLTKDRQIGVIGLGSLGLPVAVNIQKTGFRVLGYRRHSAHALAGTGVAIAESVSEVGRGCAIIITCLPSAAALREVVSGHGGLVASVRPGTVIVDLGTFPIPAKMAQAEALDAVDASMLDCGVSGNERYVAERSAALFVGGTQTDFDQCLPVLAAITNHVTYVGRFGAGTTMKLIASLLVPIHTLAAAEAFALASRAGIDPRIVFDAIKGTQASSAMFESRGARMLAADYSGSSLRGYSERNIEMAIETARRLGGHYPLLEAVHACYRKAIKEGFGDLDQAGIFEFLLKQRF